MTANIWNTIVIKSLLQNYSGLNKNFILKFPGFKLGPPNEI